MALTTEAGRHRDDQNLLKTLGQNIFLAMPTETQQAASLLVDSDAKMSGKLESRPDWQVALATTVVGRAFFSAVAAVFSLFLHPDPALIHSNALTENLPAPHGPYYALLGIWERFDTLWYLRIAHHGYDLPMAVIFYPLYPLAIRAASWGLPAIAAALAVSTIAAFFFFWGLLRLAAPKLPEAGRLRVLLLVVVWPTSFILFAGYAESLTLALIMWAVVFAREQRWGAATVCGLLAGMSRPSGVLVSIPLFVLGLRSRRARALAVLLTPMGLLSYWGWLRWSGHVSVVEAYRLHQGMTLVAPWTGAWEALRVTVTQGDALLAVKLGLVVLFAALSLRRDVRIEDKLFALAVILQMLMYTGRPLLGALRYLLLVYPAFMVLAGYAGRRSWKQFSFYLVALEVLNLACMWAFLNWSLVL
jgi:hypothetical protein